MARVYGSVACDSCNVANDGDPLETIEATQNSYGITNPTKLRELLWFWLCPDCKVDYPNGARSFFVPEYFDTSIHYCGSCETEEVEADGYWCDTCEGGE